MKSGVEGEGITNTAVSCCRKAHQAELWEMSSWRRAADGPAALETSLRGDRTALIPKRYSLKRKMSTCIITWDHCCREKHFRNEFLGF